MFIDNKLNSELKTEFKYIGSTRSNDFKICLKFNEKIITPIISALFKNINGEKFIKSCMTKVSNKFFYSSDLELGFMVLFSFDYLYLVHPCICEFIETDKISETNNSLIELKKKLF